MNKKILEIIIILLLTFTFSGCQKGNLMKDYPSLTDKDHCFKIIKIDKVIDMLEEDASFYLVMGFPECPWCQALMPILNEVAKANDVKSIYYLNIKELRDVETAKGRDLYLQLENYYFKDAIDQEKKRLNAPTFVRVDEGNLTKYHLNTTSDHIKNENGVLPPLTDEQQNELKTILAGFF